MRIGVLANIQFSMFSAGVANTSLSIAELFKALGHEVNLISITDKLWWDDCTAARESWTVVPLKDASGYDLLVEIDRMMLPTENRAKIAQTAVWLVRQPFLIGEIEASLFPTAQTPRREFAGLQQIWIFDTAAIEEGAIQALELLSNLPVKLAPFLWTPTIAETHMKALGVGSWIEVTVSELRRQQKTTEAIPAWKAHVAEKNTSNGSSAVIPLVILREAKRRKFSLGPWKIHNAEMITKSKFFIENVLHHCSDLEGPSGELIGRQRSVEWALDPMSFVLAHSRFSVIRPLLLDAAWAGIPIVHNSPYLREIGCGLERFFYSDNHIGEACEALRHMENDFVKVQGIFAKGALENIRTAILKRCSPLDSGVQSVWRGLIDSLNITTSIPMAVAVAPSQPLKGASQLRVGFSDMWENFNPSYNFFTLMLAAAGAKLDPPVEVVGGPATAEDSVVIFGPFGTEWTKLPAEQPKIHFTGENTEPLDGPGVKLNLGFHHFDMVNEEYLRFPLWILEIDWFGADATRIANPKPIPLEACTTVLAADVARKKKFCAFVVSNPTNPARNAAFQWLSEYKRVDSAGRHMNNMGDGIFAGAGGGGGELRKLEFLRDYKFCLAYENNSARGYTTEKFLHAKAAGCIPIYWGDPAVERDFSLAGAIDARDFKSPDELIEAVRRIDENDSEWLKRFAVPALDAYRVAWCHRTMAECARRIFGLGGFSVKSFPLTVGDTAVVKRAPAAAPAAATAPAPATAPAAALEVPLMVTSSNRKFLSSLQQWLTSLATQKRALPGLKARVYLFSDVPEDTEATLKESFDFVTFTRLPDKVAPEGAFPDFWDPAHYGWKLWVLHDVATSAELAGSMAMYIDAGAFLCRWPKEWMLTAQASGLCFLEDSREENRRWCSPAFCAAMKLTEPELAAQQRLGGLVMFRAGAPLAMRVFKESLELGKRREILAGAKWSGTNAAGKPYGHRHDQSILSIVSLRHGAATVPLDTVYCDTSLRKTFTSGRAIYVHRGDFQAHRPFLEGIDDSYVINLERRADRLERLWNNCPELKGRVERWPAIDGRSLTLTPAIQRLLNPNDFHWKKAIAGCALSHLGLWWKLAHEHPDIKNYLILEDDVKFRPGWEKVWKAAVDDIPEDYDIIYLGGVLPPNRGGFEEKCKERVNDSFCRIKENTVWGQSPANRYFHFCAYSYILTKQGAQKVLGLIQNAGGYWTSADHILCNPVTVLKSYILEPMVAGCYQDDDPKYANSEFNDFSRIDGFDSDLWNNDDRFTNDPGFAQMGSDAELDIEAALREARAVAAAVAQPVAPPPALVVPKGSSKPFTQLPKRFVCLSDHNLKLSQLHEHEWLLHLFGNPSTFTIDTIRPNDPPPTDAPIMILQRPHTQLATSILEKWDSFGAKFSILHLSDEHANDTIEAYSLDSCEKVLRFYKRPDTDENPKVTTIPLGFHWTLLEGPKDMATLTPRLPFRQMAWSFFGTDWNGRAEQLQPLKDIGEKYDCTFYKEWNDASALGRSDYISKLLDTVFVPCPDGVNPETFRFYEALECGCIPLLVRTEKNADWVDWVSENTQVLPVKSWEDAAQLMAHLLKNKTMLEAYRAKVLTAWLRWRKTLVQETKEWLGSQ
jgi:GR25 family glycosyltransferase involved in LPS biosynthesis